MSLLVDQLIYTSFPKVGFKSLVSSQVSLEIQQTFIQEIVYRHWDAYNPIKAGHHAAYLYQFSPEQSLFGWLYTNETDDVGRTNTPYFICYYLSELLNTTQLEHILTCLRTGPITLIDRHNPPKALERMTLPDSCRYEPVRRGVEISSTTHQQIHRELQQRQLLNLFVSTDITPETTQIQPPIQDDVRQPLQISSKVVELSLATRQVVKPPENINTIIAEILQELVAKPIGVQGVALVSIEGRPMTTPMGMDENSTLIIAGTMLYLANSTRDELNWQKIENISVRGQEGHIMLNRCTATIFLLVKAGKILTGLLEGEINRTVKKLQAVLQDLEDTKLQPEILPRVSPEDLPKVDEVLYDLNDAVSLKIEDDVRYRGRGTT
jgi:predicted regulator of Ras-like GTPase activity (Roadblock/LC7/MglB family)